MKIKPEQDKATPRPWYFDSDYDNDKDVTFPSSNIAGTIRDDEGWNIARIWKTEHKLNGEANAALIVRAVNEYDALNAVAEAAENLCSTIRCGAERVATVKMMSDAVEKSLATLAALRKEQP